MLEVAPVILVDPEISRTKFRRELELWLANAAHRQRGWVLLHHDVTDLTAELAFLGKVSISSGSSPLPIVVCAIRLRYDNYDLWPPSLTFIDAFSGEPARPHVRALMPVPHGSQNVLIDAHPTTGLPFLCVAGVREYHSHPQHNGDSWLLHRAAGEGSLSTVCDRVWRYMARNVLGLSIQVQGLPTMPLQAQLVIALTQVLAVEGSPVIEGGGSPPPSR